jgi:hypothetical protein
MVVPGKPIILEGSNLTARDEVNKRINDFPRNLSESVEQNLEKLEQEAESVLKKVLDGILGRKK